MATLGPRRMIIAFQRYNFSNIKNCLSKKPIVFDPKYYCQSRQLSFVAFRRSGANLFSNKVRRVLTAAGVGCGSCLALIGTVHAAYPNEGSGRELIIFYHFFQIT